MRYGLKVITPATATPVTDAELKAHLRVDSSDEDSLIAALNAAATEYAESFCRRCFMEQTLRMTMDFLPCGLDPIILPRAPVKSITAVRYVDTDGVTQTIDSDDYVVDLLSEPGRIAPAYDRKWPSARMIQNAVSLDFVAGYDAGSPGDEADQRAAVPESVKAAIKLLAAHWFENRSPVVVGQMPAEIPLSAKHLLWMNRVPL